MMYPGTDMTPDQIQSILSQYSRVQLDAFRARGMLDANGIPTVPPTVPINSGGEPYSRDLLNMPSDQEARQRDAYAGLKSGSFWGPQGPAAPFYMPQRAPDAPPQASEAPQSFGPVVASAPIPPVDAPSPQGASGDLGSSIGSFLKGLMPISSAQAAPAVPAPLKPAPVVPMQQAMQPPTPGDAPIGAGIGKLAPVAISALQGMGLSPAATQGIMANGLGEGGFNSPWVKANAPGENSFGHWQLNKAGELPNYLANEGKDSPQDTANQARFVARRMEELHPGFKDITDPKVATSLVLNQFERPAVRTPRDNYLQTVQANWTGSPVAASPAVASSPDQILPQATRIGQGTPQGIIKVADNGTSSFTGQGIPGVGANGLQGLPGLQGISPDATPQQVLEAFLKTNSADAQRMKLMMGLQGQMPPKPNTAATLARMAAGFLGGKGGAASLAGGFGGMAEGLSDNTHTANQFQFGNLKSLEGVLPDPKQESMQERMASQFMRSGMAPGDAFVAAGLPMTPDRQQLLNSQAQAGKPLPSIYQKTVDNGISELGTLRAGRAALMTVQDAVQSGELKLDPVHQLMYQAQAAAGNPLGDPAVTKYQQYVALQHTLQNDVLKGNKGIQTDKDASNAMAMIAGGGIKSSDQYLQHSNFLLNRMELEEPNVKTRIGLAYQNAKQQMPSGLMDTIEQTLPGVPPRATPKEIGGNMYGSNGRQPVAAPAAPTVAKVGNGTGVGLSAEDMALINKYRTR